MKALLCGLIVGVLLAAGNFTARAQTNAPATNAPSAQMAREYKMISFLTTAQQVQYAEAHQKALADNPALKSEGENLMKQGETIMADGTAADKQGFIEKMNSHRQKLRAAMLKEDPTLEPIFAEIDKHISEMKAKQQAAAQK